MIERCIARAWPQKFWDQLRAPGAERYDPALDIVEAPLAGPHEFDITDQVLKIGERAALAIRDNDASSEERWCHDNRAGILYCGLPGRVEASSSIKAFFAARRAA